MEGYSLQDLKYEKEINTENQYNCFKEKNPCTHILKAKLFKNLIFRT